MVQKFTSLKGTKVVFSLLIMLASFTASYAQIDVTRPTVTSVSPASWSIGINSGISVSATFSEAMNPATINGTTFELRNALNNTLVTATVVYNATTRTAILYPTSPLNSLLFEATVKGGSSGVKDAAGNTMTSDYSWYFIMIPLIDLTPPTVLAVTPANGATGVNINTSVTAVMSEEMLPSSVSTATVELRNAANVLIPSSVSYNVSTRTITFTPLAPLSLASLYKATIKGGSAGVKDEDGNTLASNYTWSFTTVTSADVVRPTILSVLPVSGTTGVPAGTTVSATFSEAMNASSVNTSTFELRNASNTLVAATVTYNATTKTAVLTPSAALAYSTVYTATVKGGTSGVKDLTGNAMANNYTWSFTTSAPPDITPPTIVFVSPASNSSGVGISTAVTATFSEAMNASTINTSTFELRNSSNTLITATVSYNASTKMATLTSSAALAYSTAYTATVKGGASGMKDVAGNALLNNYSWIFTTMAAPDVTPPTVISVLPVNNSTGVALNTVVTATFSEAMNASTITTSTVELRNASSTLITATVTYNATTKTATLTPSAALAYSTVYTATVKNGASGVKDVAGNALVNSYSWIFTTMAAPDVTPPTVIAVSPLNNSTGVVANTGVSAVFSEAMNASTISTSTIELKNSSSALITATVTYNATTKTVTLTPSAALAYSTVYTATVKGGVSGVKDAAGNALVNNYAWVFTTMAAPDVTPPTVVSVLPVNNSTGLAINTSVSAVFSEAMNVSTISTSTVELRNASSALVTATVAYNATTRTATLTPLAALAYSTLYTATVKGGTSGVKDAAGNALMNNYSWVFTTMAAPDVTAPTIISVAPAATANGVGINAVASATFSEPMNLSTISTGTVELRNSANTVLSATVDYDPSTKTATLTPSAALLYATVYTVTVRGGASGVKDAAGNAMVNDYSWTFTTGASLFDPGILPDFPAYIDNPVEVGMRFRSSVNGQITGLRFYKGLGNVGTHIGHLWTNTGTQLTEAVFTNETEVGWQQVLLSTPVNISAGATYVVSYYSVAGIYAYSNNYFTQPLVTGPLTALADGQDGANGIYKYSASSIFPTDTYLSTNYFVDVVFAGNPDNIPPAISAVNPGNGAGSVDINTTVTASFNEVVSTPSVNSSTVELRDASGTLVPATITYNASSATAVLTPASPLSYNTNYTAKVKGGTAGIKDLAGNAMVNDYTWTFKTADAPFIAPTEGPGGPILVVSTTTNPFSRYAVEILRAEGLNEFAASDVSAVTETILNNYDVVVLGEMTVTAAQVTMFTNWVNAGGTLIAFKPSALLAPLMGIGTATGTLSDKYLLINTASAPGVGLVNQTIQFHGTANLHALSGATSVATLYSTASVATSNPAVTRMNVGTSGGRAYAFTYDLAKSIVYTRQGNPAWAGQKRDGEMDPIRSDDLFYPDWIDFNKIAIPQADEQQRLLANIILQSNLHRKPLPRFWYLPRDLKAAVVMTGDDHAVGGTATRFNQYQALGFNTAQDVADWKAVRGTSYIYPNTPLLTNAQAAAFESQGFEISLHPETGCQNYTFTSLLNNFNTQLGQFTGNYPGLSSPATNRTHCLVWSDWASQPKVELQKGIRFDVTYYYWPELWMQNRPGMFTGSGMPMRFADMDGSLIDVYQAPTQMTDETNMDYTTFCNAVLDKAIGSEGYYGVFTANMHTDYNPSEGSDAIVASAQARGVPVISAKQMLTWLDGRNNSSFGNMTWNNNQLTFTVTARSGANNIKTMLPLFLEGGQPLLSITKDGNSVPFTTQTIKGMQYAFFAPGTGVNTFVANYAVVSTRVSNTQATETTATAPTLPATMEAKQPTETKTTPALAGKIYVNVLPNPSTDYFNVVISSNDPTPVTVRVLDIYGHLLEVHQKVTSTGILRLGQSWRGGAYYAEIIRGEERKVIKLLKTN